VTLDKFKAFCWGIVTMFGAVLVFIFRSRQIAQAEAERDRARVQVKELEARREVDKKFEGRSDRDVVLSAIDDELRRSSDSE
jgi:hypothetical protein